MALPDGVTEKTRMVSRDDFEELMNLAWRQVTAGDENGPIDCIVPYNGANIYMQAISRRTGDCEAERCADAVGNPSFRLRSAGVDAWHKSIREQVLGKEN